jgi:hypothetical protein
VADWRESAGPGRFDSIYLNGVLRDVADRAAAVKKLEVYRPTRLVVREMAEVVIGLPYKLRSHKGFHFDGGRPARYGSWEVRVYDV